MDENIKNSIDVRRKSIYDNFEVSLVFEIKINDLFNRIMILLRL